MKKITAMLLALVLAFGLLSGCSDGDSAASSAPEPAKQETASASEQAPAVSEEAVQEASSEPEASSSEETVEEEVYELPLTTDGETLTMFAITNSNVTDNIGELGNHQIYVEAEKITGVKVNIQAVMQEAAVDRVLYLAVVLMPEQPAVIPIMERLAAVRRLRKTILPELQRQYFRNWAH